MAFALKGFGHFPCTAKVMGPWNEHGLVGEGVESLTPDAYRAVMVCDGETHRRRGLVEYGELNGVPTLRVSRFDDMVYTTSGLEWPSVLRDTISTTELELRVTKVELNAHVDAAAFRPPGSVEP